jgi:hypothetical protein
MRTTRFVLAFLVIFFGSALAQEIETEKESAADILDRVINDEGVDAARSRFQELKREQEKYLFDQSEFLALGSRLLDEERAPDAVAVLQMAAELFPDDIFVHFRLAGAYWAAGEPELSMKSTLRRKALEDNAALAELLENNQGKLASTAGEVIEKHIEAVGGRDALAAVRTMVVTFSANSTGGKIATLARYYKRPYFYRQGGVGSDRFAATDGETTWRVNGEVWKEIGEHAYRRMASIDGYFVDYEDRGVSYEFLGAEIFNNTPVYRLKRTYWDGYTQDLFFSIESGYLTEIRSEYPEGNPVMISVMSLWDYRDVGGIKIPHVFIRNVGPLGPPHGGVVEDVQINVPLDDSMFVKPQ